MKKAILIIVTLLVIGTVAIAGCTSIGDTVKSTLTDVTNSTTTSTTSEPTVIYVTPEKYDIVGTWIEDFGDKGNIVVTMNGDGTCNMRDYVPYNDVLKDSSGDVRKELIFDGNYTMIGENKYVFQVNHASISYYSGKTTSDKISDESFKFIINQTDKDEMSFVKYGDEDGYNLTKI